MGKARQMIDKHTLAGDFSVSESDTGEEWATVRSKIVARQGEDDAAWQGIRMVALLGAKSWCWATESPGGKKNVTNRIQQKIHNIFKFFWEF